MSNLEHFKEFVKTKPNLIKYVKNNEMTWQKFYELYDLYGPENEVWNTYEAVKQAKVVEAAAKTVGFADIMGYFKNIDLDSLSDNINNIQRVVGVIQDLGTKDTSTTTSSYKPRPIYKHFED